MKPAIADAVAGEAVTTSTVPADTVPDAVVLHSCAVEPFEAPVEQEITELPRLQVWLVLVVTSLTVQVSPCGT